MGLHHITCIVVGVKLKVGFADASFRAQVTINHPNGWMQVDVHINEEKRI